MGVYIEGNKRVIIKEPKNYVDNNMKNETDFNIKHNELFAEDAIKTRLASYCANISMKTIFISTENSKIQ